MDMPEDTIWKKLNTGVEVGRDCPGIDDFDRAVTEALDLRMRYNSTVMTKAERTSLLSVIIKAPVLENTVIVPPFQCDLGFNIKLGKNVLVNYNFVLLDCAEIRIGDGCLLGPGCKLVTASHPMEPARRHAGLSVISRSIVLEDDVWLGAGVIILPGVTIGHGSVVGAGSVVTKNVPPDSVVAGDPAHLLRRL
jgi:maltose O-acetyltransferase